jgi:hypothetical protein
MTRSASHDVRTKVSARAQGRCEYCRVPTEAAWAPHEVDHIIARKHGGKWGIKNLAYACFECNHHKGTDYRSFDPLTGEDVRLFNPRRQKWDTHFQLDINGVITPQTTIGRATARLLHFNDRRRVQQRAALIVAGKLRPTSEQVS